MEMEGVCSFDGLNFIRGALVASSKVTHYTSIPYIQNGSR